MFAHHPVHATIPPQVVARPARVRVVLRPMRWRFVSMERVCVVEMRNHAERFQRVQCVRRLPFAAPEGLQTECVFLPRRAAPIPRAVVPLAHARHAHRPTRAFPTLALRHSHVLERRKAAEPLAIALRVPHVPFVEMRRA